MQQECYKTIGDTVSSIGVPRTPAANGAITPEYIRLPHPGLPCPYTGLKRSKLNELILPSELNGYRPPVRSVCLRNKGGTKGVRLVVYASLIEYLRAQERPTTEQARNIANAQEPHFLQSKSSDTEHV